MTRAPAPGLVRAVLSWILLLVAVLGPAAAVRAAPDDEFSRVGRVVQVQGRAWIYDDEERRWSDAQRNRAVTEGDRFQTESGAFLQLAVGSTELRLAGGTEIAFDRLTDDRVRIRVLQGSLAVRVRSRDVLREIDWLAGDVKAWPERTGHYRIDRLPQAVALTTWRGRMSVDTRDQQLAVDAGRRVELWREGRDGTAVTWGGVQPDAFSDRVVRDEERDDRLGSTRYVSSELTGANELDSHGRWERHPEFGMVWFPLGVAVDWAPFRHGRWYWHVRWGWTWLDEAPWGFATSHYGRWVSWGGRWCWVPGAYTPRPIYAPAVVAWPSQPPSRHAPPSVWTPLGPRDPHPPVLARPPMHPPGMPDHAMDRPRMGDPGHVPSPRIGEPSRPQPPRTHEPSPLPVAPRVAGPQPGFVEPEVVTGRPPRGDRGAPMPVAPAAPATPQAPAVAVVPSMPPVPGVLPSRPEPRVEPRPDPRPEVRPEVRPEPRSPNGREFHRKGDPVATAAPTVVPTAPVAPVAERSAPRAPEAAPRDARKDAPAPANREQPRMRAEPREQGRDGGRERQP